MKRFSFAASLVVITVSFTVAQTNPTPQSLPYSQNFGTTSFSVMPSGTAAWNGLNGGSINSQALAESSTPTGDATVAAQTTTTSTGGTYGYETSGNGRLYVQTSSNATNGVNQLGLSINTEGKENIRLSFDIEMLNAGPRSIGVVAQYRIGTTGSWTTISGSVYQHNSSTKSNGDIDQYLNLSLASNANNKAVVQIRWAIWRGSETGSSSGIGIDNISIVGDNIVSPVISLTPTTLSNFSYIVGSGPSSSQSYQLSGSNLDPADGDITVTGSTNYEVSTNNSTFSSSVNVAYTGGTLSSTTIYVRLKSGLSAGLYNSETISNSGGGATTQNVTVNGKVFPTEPTVQASNINFTDVTETGMTINWTNGDGDARIVFVRYFLPVYTLPVDGTSYPENSNYGAFGFDINVVDYVVYKGSGSSVAVTGLTRSRLYHVAVYEYNGSDNYENYLTTNAPLASQRTNGPAFTEILLPQYMQGAAGTNNQRVPFAYRVTISGLSTSATYRYYNTVVIDIDGHTNTGAGNAVYAKLSGDFVRTASTGLSTAGSYGEFTTDGSGNYSGWFITEPTGNSRFTAAGIVYAQIVLNDGAGGTIATTRLTMDSPINVIGFGTSPLAGDGSGIRSLSGAAPKDFVFLYDNESGSGRPISGTFVESDGTSDATYVGFYQTEVNGINGAWGTIIPNILPDGIRRIERRLLSDGSIGEGTATSPDGVWGIVNTVNPSGGSTPFVIPASAAPLPVELVSFTAAVHNKKVLLSWKTETEVNNYGFEIQRAAVEQNEIPENGAVVWTKIGFVSGSGNSNSPKEYSYTDNTVTSGKYNYRLKQIDTDGQFAYSPVVNADLGLPTEYMLSQNYPNPFNPSTKIRFSLPKASNVKISVHNILGQEVAKLVNDQMEAGEHTIEFNAGDLSSGTYFYRIQSPDYSNIRKMTLVR